jgi:hypothetical protein
MKLRDRIRAESVVQGLSWRLGWAYVPARQQRDIVRELRAGLEEAAGSGDLDEAIERLGSTRELAREYADVLQPRVRWLAGVMWAAIAFAAVVWIGIIAALAFAAGLDAAAVAQGSYDLWPSLAFGDEAFLVEERDAQGDVTGASMSLLTPVHLVAMVVAFVVGSRPWRLLRRER